MIKLINESFDKKYKCSEDSSDNVVANRPRRRRPQKEIATALNRDANGSKQLKEAPSYDLRPQYDARQSFYSKARVDDENGVQTLYSYNTPVARIAGGKVELLPKWDLSQTTLRHVKEFLKQNGFEATSLAQMRRDYL